MYFKNEGEAAERKREGDFVVYVFFLIYLSLT
jgi:hypothetical protein